MLTTKMLNKITTIATYKWDTHTDYSFHCGECGYDTGRVMEKVERCPKCAPAVSSEIIVDEGKLRDVFQHLKTSSLNFSFCKRLVQAYLEAVGFQKREVGNLDKAFNIVRDAILTMKPMEAAKLNLYTAMQEIGKCPVLCSKDTYGKTLGSEL